MPNVAFSTYTYTAGGTTARTTANRAADAISVKEYGCVGDGVTNDSAAWLTAIASGRSLFVPPGTYILANAVATPSSGQCIYGIPGKSILSKTPNNTDYLFPTFDIVDVDDVTIDGLTITLALPPATRQIGIHIRVSTGVYGDTSRIKITNCTFNNALVNIARFVNGVLVHGNLFDGGGTNGALNGVSTGNDWGTAGVDGLTNSIIIQNNYFTRIRGEAVDINWHTWNSVVDSNVVVDCNTTPAGADQEAIDIGGGSVANYCKNIVVSNNVVQYTDPTIVTSGIRVKLLSRNVSVIGNTVETANATATNGAGIAIKDVENNVTVVGNTVTGFAYGILGELNGGPTNGIVISDNTIRNPSIRGISHVNLAATTTDIAITGNVITTSVVTTPQWGILLQNATDFIVTGNRISGFLTDGILVQTTASDGSITGNEVSGCNDGIRILGPRVAITGNTCRANRRNGFNFTAVHLTITGNQAYNNAQVTANSYGFQFNAGANYLVIVGNKSYDSQGTPTQNGFNFGAALDNVLFTGNNARPVKTVGAGITGETTLTNSIITGNLDY